MRQTFVYIICSPRPLVGKTLVSRLLTEFLLLKNGEVVAFDINLKEPSLLDYLPDVTETAEIDDTYGKMALMDRLIVNDGIAKVIDLGFHAFDEFFTMSEEIGFIKEAALRGELPPGFGAHGRILHIAALQAFLKNYVDRLTFSFTAYLRSEKDSSSELHEWIRENYITFRDLELDLIEQKK